MILAVGTLQSFFLLFAWPRSKRAMRLLRGSLRAAAAEAGRVHDKDEGAWHRDNAVARGLASGAVSKSTVMAQSMGEEESVCRH